MARFVIFTAKGARQDAFFNTPPPSEFNPEPLCGIAYDVGANNGDDTAYYLARGLNVVAIEANPLLAQRLTLRFVDEIASGRVVVVNTAVAKRDGLSIDFYVHHENDKISTAIPPTDWQDSFQKITVAAQRLSNLIGKHGSPLYVKIDIEGSDGDVLSELFSAGVRPKYVSAECHSIDVLCHLVSAGYEKFKIVEGRYVHCAYYSGPGTQADGTFPKGTSCGPFGEDIPGDWTTANEVFAHLAEHGLGWKDIHATL